MKSKFENKNRIYYAEKSGITLISLVITIIVLLLLAGIAINIIEGNNGVLNKAIQAKKGYEKSIIEDNIMLALYECEMKYQSEKEQNQALTRKDIYTKENLQTFLNEAGEVTYYKYSENGTSTININSINDNEYIFDVSKDGKISQQTIKSYCASLAGVKVGDYVNYPVTYANVYTNHQNNGQKVSNSYVGWRVLAIENSGLENEYVKLVTAGVPLRYFHGENAPADAEALTTNFWSTEFSGNGFVGQWGSQLFENDYTDHNANGTTKVRAMTKPELDTIYSLAGLTGTPNQGKSVVISDATSQYYNLLAIPCTTSGYASYWLATAAGSWKMWNIGGWYGDVDPTQGIIYEGYCYDFTSGVRPVVYLKTSVEFYKNNEDASEWSIVNK